MADPVLVDAGVVSTITVNRPERLNALNTAVLDALWDALAEVESAETRVLVITGAGDDAFVAGADIEELRDRSPEEAMALVARGHRVMDRIESFPAPVVASINGYALGGGLELALACDLRVASSDALLGLPETDLGIVPAWGGTQRLPQVVGDELARRMIFFGERVDAQDAHEFGLVGDLVAHDELDEYVEEFATDLAERPHRAVQAAKASIDRAGDGAAGFAYERRAASGLWGSHDQREGMAAFVEDREPEFE